MENIGALSVLLALCLAVYGVAANIAGTAGNRPYLLASGRRAVYAVWLLVTVASGVLVASLLNDDFRLAYVAAQSNREMPVSYKFAAWWGGQEGSLLFWTWLLSTYTALSVAMQGKRDVAPAPWSSALLLMVQIFFLLLNAFVASPFQVFTDGGGVTAPADGNGLNPLLQDPLMRIHPPLLYLGYVGATIPFAMTIGALIAQRFGKSWRQSLRRWTLVTWLFQTVGIVLGANWAYAALGWGGYWVWDPVENASLLPWLTTTAFLHSMMMQEQRGMLKVWNAVLVSASFFLAILGTLITRSGVITSVHAFAQSAIGNYFLAFLAVGIAATAWVILDRLPFLASEAPLDSVLSRESSFLFNNLVFLASCFAVLWGTLFPTLAEYLWEEKVSLDPTWFNRIMAPLGIFLLLLMGVGPLLPWRTASSRHLKKHFQWPGAAACISAAVLFLAGNRNLYVVICAAACVFVTWTILAEFWRGARGVRAQTGMHTAAALLELTHRNTRRYGGYVVHLGIVLMFVGFCGAAFNQDRRAEFLLGSGMEIGPYRLVLRDVTEGETANYAWQRARLELFRNQSSIAVLTPERQVYRSSGQGIGRVDIHHTVRDDVYVNFAGVEPSGRAVVEVYLFPLVNWIWAGALVLLVGTGIALIPAKKSARAAASEPANEREHATVDA